MELLTERRLHAETEALELDNGTTTFMFLSTALVQFMTPGLAFFYSGMVGTRSTVAVMFQSMVALGVVFSLWVTIIFSMTFGKPLLQFGDWKIIGDPRTYFMTQGVHVYQPLQRAGAVVAPGFPGMLFMAFQGMFAVITPALVSGAFVDRVRFMPYLLFVTIWMFVVYAPLGYWNWGGGWMFQYGAWDFAGGMVVHESAGFSALGSLLALGPRDQPNRIPAPHSIPMVILGTGFLWFGWFGFNGGSALTIGGLATIAFVNTQIAPAVGMMTWIAMDWVFVGKPNMMGACAGAVTGLVVITPSAGFVQPHLAVFAGLTGAIFCWNCSNFIKTRTNLDDTCDTVGVHGMGGFLGTIYVGILSDPVICSSSNPPVWCANPGTCTRSFDQFVIQTVCAFASAGYSIIVTYVIFKIMAMFTSPLRTWEQQESTHDIQEFGEVAYKMEGFGDLELLGRDLFESEEESSDREEQSPDGKFAKGAMGH